MGEAATEPQRYPQVVRAITETPWAILEGTLATILDIVGHRLEGERFSKEEIEARVGNRAPAQGLTTAGSVAVLPISGVIIPKATLFSEMSGGTSIQGLQEDFRAALADEAIKAIVLDIDSPGGMTDMVPEFAAELRASRGQKPIVAVASPRAASAAYWLGSQADEFVATPSGDVGSIGVFGVHKDASGMEAKLGVKTTLVSAGKYKVEGNQFEPLTDEARASMQDRVDEMYDIFAGDVARGRNVSVDTVRSGYGEGRMLSARKALAAGMIDRVDTLESVVAKLQNPSGRSRVAKTLSIEIIGNMDPGLIAGPISPHSTATVDSPWDGPAAKANLRNDGDETYYRSAYAWQDSGADAKTKAAYKFIHHEVGADGKVGAANLNGCNQGIAVLNGGRTGTTIPDGDRQGVWDHLAKHIRDGGKEPPPLKSQARFSDGVDEAHRALEAVVEGALSLRVLPSSKREQVTALIGRWNERLAETVEAQDGSEREVELAISVTETRLRGL